MWFQVPVLAKSIIDYLAKNPSVTIDQLSNLFRGDSVTARAIQKHVEIIKQKQDNSELSLRGMAEQFGMSYERIRQILNQYGVSTKRTVKLPCPVCGKPRRSKNRRYCSKECKYIGQNITLNCASCGSPVVRSKKIMEWHKKRGWYKDGLVFCNHVCRGRHLGKNYGWGKRKKKDCV